MCHFDSKSTDVLNSPTNKPLHIEEVKELRRKLDILKVVHQEVDHILCIVTNRSLSTKSGTATDQELMNLLGDDMCVFAEGPEVTLEAMFGSLSSLLSIQARTKKVVVKHNN